MNNNELKSLKSCLKVELSENKIALFEKYRDAFLKINSSLNLISKNDEKFLFEKHIFDSLALNLFFMKLKIKPEGTLLDIGTGGGFPSVPLSVLFSNLEVLALDSIRKKINAIDALKSELGLKNLSTLCERAEKVEKKFDFVTSRAVASMDLISKYALARVKPGGYFIAYKSLKASEEIKEAQKTLKKFNAKVIDIIDYTLPLEEKFERNLIVIRK